jgi:hypothetical protein
MRYRKLNNNWKGGRRITSHGYIEIKVDKNHPLRNANGYAYEHRIKAMEKLNRKLRKGEIIHHIDGNKQNNDYNNIEICKYNIHRYKHRTVLSKKKTPFQKNYKVKCKCGCKTEFYKYDKSNRPRKYVSGHNPVKSFTKDLLLKILYNNQLSNQDIIKLTNKTKNQINSCLCRLKKQGILKNIKYGLWTYERSKNGNHKN